jgi:hypothetical protein
LRQLAVTLGYVVEQLSVGHAIAETPFLVVEQR